MSLPSGLHAPLEPRFALQGLEARGEKVFEGFEHEGKLRKLAAMLFGVRIKNARSRRFWFPLETEKDGKRTFDFKFLSIEFEEPMRDDCWATPGIPLLIFITIGFMAYILMGDLLGLILRAFF